MGLEDIYTLSKDFEALYWCFLLLNLLRSEANAESYILREKWSFPGGGELGEPCPLLVGSGKGWLQGTQLNTLYSRKRRRPVPTIGLCSFSKGGLMFRGPTWAVGRIPSAPWIPAGHVPSLFCRAPPPRAEPDRGRSRQLPGGYTAQRSIGRERGRDRKSALGDTGACAITLRTDLGVLCRGLVSQATENVAVVAPMK